MGHRKKTSKEIASKAAKILRNPRASKQAKSLAGSALSQSPGKHRRRKKKR